MELLHERHSQLRDRLPRRALVHSTLSYLKLSLYALTRWLTLGLAHEAVDGQ